MNEQRSEDRVVRVVYWKRSELWAYSNWMPLSWVERVMAKEGARRWRIGR